ncbi:MAG: hypothetical protein ACXVI6_08075, partial [Candidatus Aminicenantales bacterium]
ALGVSFLGADAANVWIHLHPGADPHSLIDDGPDPPAPTRNYWPVALAAQTLSSSDPAVPVSVLAVTLDTQASVMTGYAVKKADGTLGLLLLNKGPSTLDVAVDLSSAPQSVSGRIISPAEYESGSGPSALPVRVVSRRLRCSVPGSTIAGLEIR